MKGYKMKRVDPVEEGIRAIGPRLIAVENESLRAKIDTLLALIEKADALAEAVGNQTDEMCAPEDAVDRAYAAYQEARKG